MAFKTTANWIKDPTSLIKDSMKLDPYVARHAIYWTPLFRTRVDSDWWKEGIKGSATFYFDDRHAEVTDKKNALCAVDFDRKAMYVAVSFLDQTDDVVERIGYDPANAVGVYKSKLMGVVPVIKGIGGIYGGGDADPNYMMAFRWAGTNQPGYWKNTPNASMRAAARIAVTDLKKAYNKIRKTIDKAIANYATEATGLDQAVVRTELVLRSSFVEFRARVVALNTEFYSSLLMDVKPGAKKPVVLITKLDKKPSSKPILPIQLPTQRTVGAALMIDLADYVAYSIGELV